ncbi:hypothetical protein MRY82_05205 [bacterium]|nr:hypothetical protein [bacterium]
MKKYTTFLFAVVFSFTQHLILAQERGLIGSEFRAFQKMTESNLINNEDRQKIICEYATLYEVNPTAIASILWKQGEFQDAAELVMADRAKKMALNKNGYASLIQHYKSAKIEDQELESHGMMTPRRNSFDGAIFNSIGASEIKIYMAMRMVEMNWFHDAQKYINADGDPDPLNITQALTEFEGTIEFVAAELYWMKKTYASIAEINDVTQNLGMVWQLHKAGNFKALAMRRRTRQLSGDPIPKAASSGFIPKEIRNAIECSRQNN